MDISKLASLARSIRILSAEAVQKANSGHPGMPMGAADMASVLFANHLRFDPRDPDWIGRDRFVLSAGHGSMLLYSLLHLFQYKVSLDDIKNFRQWDSITPGHPEFGMTPGVETTTGPLGQGFGNGVGLALSAKMLTARYGTDLLSTRVFGIVSDGDLMEGISSEAASIAGHLKLGNIVYLYDDNHISIGGKTDVCFSEDVPKRFEACGWHVQSVDGHDLKAVQDALTAATSEAERPSIICARTIIGKGSPSKADSAGVHGSPLGEEELAKTRAELGWSEDPFTVPKDVAAFCAEVCEEKQSFVAQWSDSWTTWQTTEADKYSEFTAHNEKSLSADGARELVESLEKEEKAATRALSGKALQIIAKHVPSLVGGSADLEPSTKTLIDGSSDIAAGEFGGKNIRFGVREHAMGALCNGLSYSGHWLPYTATFLVFADYMRPTIRLAALSHLKTLFIFTHDSFWVGEDGPTHQPIEQIESLRLIPNLHVYRPADGLEVALCYQSALARKSGPSALLFTRQGVQPLDRSAGERPNSLDHGAYVVIDSTDPDVVLVATGSEVALACESAQALGSKGKKVKVVSMPCVEIFEEQSQDFKDDLIPRDVPTVVVEAGTTGLWSSILGKQCYTHGKSSFGASAPGGVLAEKFGFTADAIVKEVLGYLGEA